MKRRQEKINTRLLRQSVVGGSVVLLLLLLCVLVNPSVESSSFATCLDGTGDEECAVSAMSQEVGVTTKTAITLATVNQVKLPDVTPTSSGTTSYASTKLAVSTNSKEGYSIFLQTGTADGNLTSVASNMDSTSKISNTTKTGVTLSNLETDSYGYALSTTAVNDNTTYSHVPTSSTAIYNKESNASMSVVTGDYPYGDEYYLAFGTKIGTSLPAGTYVGSVTVSAVANPITVTSLYDISQMQEMTSSVCENTRGGYTKQLIDSRDGKPYWVAKLKDGNCWMTQNLAYTITQEMIDNNSINSTNTDLHPNNPSLSGAGQLYTDESTGITYWNNNDAVTYKPTATNSVALTGTLIGFDVNATYSWNFGASLQATPEVKKACRVSENNGLSLISGQTPEEACESVGFVDVDNTWSSSYIARDGSWTFEDGSVYSGLVTVDRNSKTYDSHYLIGNYYQGNTAAAGTAGSIENGAAPSSICPKGWKLPIDSTIYAGVKDNGSYSYLLKFYYPTFETTMEKYAIFYDRGENFSLLQSPLTFALAGSVYRHKGGVINLGYRGNLGSSYALIEDEKARAPWFDYGFSSDTSYASVWATRRDDSRGGNGISVRCLAR